MSTSDEHIATWRDTLARQHFEHGLTQIRTAITNVHLKLRALQRSGAKFSVRVQWYITALDAITAVVNSVGRESNDKPWERQEQTTP